MKERRYTLTLKDVSISDVLTLAWCAQSSRDRTRIPYPASAGVTRKLVVQQQRIWRDWKKERRKLKAARRKAARRKRRLKSSL